MPVATPRETYEQRLAQHQAVVARLSATETRLAVVRLALFVATVALAWPALFTDHLPWWAMLVPIALFAPVVVWHARATERRERVERAVAFYRRGLDRLDDRWAGSGATGEAFRDAEHPYAGDLDLFGRGSLFELLSVARSAEGERTLARWLLEPAAVDTVRRRQQAVAELAPLLDFRERLAVTGDDVRGGLDPGALVRWAAELPQLTERWPQLLAGLLAVANVLTLGAALAGVVPWSVPFGSWALSLVFVVIHGRRTGHVLAAVERAEHDLGLLARLLACIESESFRSPLLVELRESLDTAGLPPSRRIARLARWVDLIESRHNMLFQPISALMLLGTQLAYAVEGWRAACRDGVPRWLAATGEIEALASLASHAYENPADPFPTVTDDGPRFDAAGLGHPLLPAEQIVRNDVRLGDGVQMWLVSGSNMSGKSTLLRSVGVATVMALAGAPVRAERLTVSRLAVGASMRVTDSLQEGLSHFYAEIRRLRRIVDIGEGRPPLLFLLDEILQGTNSHDRRIGAGALIRRLIEQGSIGLVTTHDLALARIADEAAPRAVNVHFEDQLEGDRIRFDYRLREGVVRRGNAVELMRAIGLPV